MFFAVAVMATVTSTVKRRSAETVAWLLSCGEGDPYPRTQTVAPVTNIRYTRDTQPLSGHDTVYTMSPAPGQAIEHLSAWCLVTDTVPSPDEETAQPPDPAQPQPGAERKVTGT